jgi:hypothetical protein
MLCDGESTKELDSFFVPIGTVESSPAIHRRVARGYLPPLFPAVNCRANFNRPYRDENLVKPNAYFFSAQHQLSTLHSQLFCPAATASKR